MNDFFRPSEHVRPIAAKIYDRMELEYAKRRTNKNWIADELNAMWEETNRQRAILGKSPVSLARVEVKEKMAYGSADYSRKIALYMDDLVRED